MSEPWYPAPFLGPVFEPGVEPVIATGYKYHPAEIALHGVESHKAIDFDAPRGTKILAPADGYYVATYGEFALTNEDGSPKTLSLEGALKGNPRNTDLKAPAGKGEFPIFFGSYVIQGWHGKGRYTQFAHVDWVNPKIPFYKSVELKDEQDKPTGDLAFSPVLRAVVSEYRKPSVAVKLKAGEVIGELGMTGCGWGQRCMKFAKIGKDGRPDFRGMDYTYYTEPHLHFMTFGKRVPRSRKPSAIWDPFGLYGQYDGGYPQAVKDWGNKLEGAKHNPLWL
ncbi:hypothetical protein EPO04_03970 [Patescibacteria group bacterium]|nr:MAG: hypothetical protein EPO04_03970 [Patescibacteria group bacterium]